MTYQHISLQEVPVSIEVLMTQSHIDAVNYEMKLANAAPAMLLALKLANEALACSKPVDANKESMAFHAAAMDAVTAILTSLSEAK
jgi:hypothetical protein